MPSIETLVSIKMLRIQLYVFVLPAQELRGIEMSVDALPLSSRTGARLKELVRRVVGPALFSTDKPYLAIAKYRAFTQQMPMMYVMLMASTWAVAATYFGHAPLASVVIFPTIVTLASAGRMRHWWIVRHTEPTVEIADRAAKKSNILAALMACGFVGWVVILYPYGDAYSKSLLAFFLAMVNMTCVFCLINNKRSAYIVFFIVNGGFAIHFGMTGIPALLAATIPAR